MRSRQLAERVAATCIIQATDIKQHAVEHQKQCPHECPRLWIGRGMDHVRKWPPADRLLSDALTLSGRSCSGDECLLSTHCRDCKPVAWRNCLRVD
jgi:hypothetical protein